MKIAKKERFLMVQSQTGITKKVKKGFSFTYLIFGPLVPLCRGHIGGFFMTLICEGLLFWIFIIVRVILSFAYNGIYINYLVKNDYMRKEIEELSEENTPKSMKERLEEAGAEVKTLLHERFPQFSNVLAEKIGEQRFGKCIVLIGVGFVLSALFLMILL